MLRSSPGWRAADLTYRAAELQYQSAQLRAGLNLSAGADASAVKVPWDTGDWKTSSNVTLSASLAVLPWSQAAVAEKNAARALQSAAAELRNNRANLTLQAAQAYLAARNAAAGLELATAQRTLAARLLQIAQNQRQQNLTSQETVLDRQAALERAAATEAEAARGVQLASGQLLRLLGQPLTLPVSSAAFSALPTLTPGTDFNALLAKAVARRPEMVRAQATLAEAQAALSIAELDARIPDLTASVRAGQLSDALGNSGRVISGSLNLKQGVLGMQATLPNRDTSSIPGGVALALSGSVPLLGSTKNAAWQQARLSVQQAELAVQTIRQSLDLEVRTKLSDYQGELEAQSAVQTNLNRAELALETARARLESGLGTTLDVQQAELVLWQAQNNLTGQQYAVALAALNLAQATTDLDPLLLTEPTGGRP